MLVDAGADSSDPRSPLAFAEDDVIWAGEVGEAVGVESAVPFDDGEGWQRDGEACRPEERFALGGVRKEALVLCEAKRQKVGEAAADVLS